LEWLAIAIFVAAVVAIITRVIDEGVSALIGLLLMILFTSYSPEQAFRAVDWNVIFILLGMWLITAYMVEGGVAEAIVSAIAQRSRSYHALLISMAIVAGFVSMFVDNVLVILLFGSITIEAARRSKANPVLAALLIGLSANFMGTALLMGDLPPQLLHSIAKAEFLDFVWHQGRPSSFPLLTITFLATSAIMYYLFVRKEPKELSSAVGQVNELERPKWQRGFLLLSVAAFAATVFCMAIRPILGIPLGFITVAGATALAFAVEVLRRSKTSWKAAPSFEKIFSERVEWKALLFYAALFGLVGGLESAGVLSEIARDLLPTLNSAPPLPYTTFYWLVAFLSTVVEHDALFLTFLSVVHEAATMASMNAWPIYWGMAWAATLASNMTVAAAPALYVAVAIAEKQGYKVSPKAFLRYSVPYVVASLAIQYALTLPIWGF
jgi:Na+/H+ antiporter NhaD/arsenite permease-like protein